MNNNRIIVLFLLVFNVAFSNNIVNIDKNKTKLEANEIILHKNENKIKLTGNVEINSGNINLYADRMIVYFNKNDGQNNITKISGNGNILLKNENINAESESFLYEPNEHIVTMYDNVKLTEKDSVAYSDKLIYNIETGNAVINSKKERVKIFINDIDGLKSRYGSK